MSAALPVAADATPLGADPGDLRAVETVVRAAGTSFYRGMRVLPPDRRVAMYAIYAFCRIVDDVADEPGPLEEKLPRLARWRERVAGLARGEADGPVTRVLVLAQRRYALREADFLAVIDGMAADCERVIVAPSLAELDLYCDQVAAAVGRLSVRAFGDGSPAADEVAFSLGRALQLTNILRDLHGGRGAGAPVPGARVAGRGGRAARRGGGPALPGPARRLRAGRGAGARALPTGARRHGPLRPARHAPGAADGRHLRRAALAPGAERLVAAGAAGVAADVAEAGHRRAAWVAGMRKQTSKHFFFEKKKQKTFPPEGQNVVRIRCKTGRSLFTSFSSEKEDASFLPGRA